MKKGSLIYFCLCLSFLFGNLLLQAQEKQQKKIIGYIMSDNVDDKFDEIAAEKLTHINYAFANIQDGEVIEGNPEDKKRLKKINSLKEDNPDLKILISVGGWTWSGGFSEAVATKTAREQFANSGISFLQNHKIDGIDLDWEYPGQPGAGNIHSPEDEQNFSLILKLFRKKLDSLGQVDQRNYLLTIATAANQEYLDHVELDKIHPYLDFINIMSYDYQGGWNDFTSHHTNLYVSETDPDDYKQSTKTAVKEHLATRVPSEKIVVGVAFYGRGWHETENKNFGLHQKASGNAFSINYRELKDSVKTGKYERHWDKEAKAPFLWREATRTFITYDDPQSIKEKAQFIKENNLGGAMFWQYHGDDGELLETLYTEIQKQ
ncbi:glycoside hydrolase family 18 protein [Salegentibacter sp. JZCK2]|uniref:glycoside hydrolase family 18 protein n=1 Tax=Salegentibacter tibetensis TaxID=2873600 RepID=UPI001CC9893A|nr:glycoside hydrolase family 18 protein [Salegentibacter tibetensis]MBZ9729137.1 glycoside hydrolase family 18 protein [Salegentibacter tibetensis]